MRFINIVLLELFAVAGSTGSALPQLFTNGRVDRNPINCLQQPVSTQLGLRTFIDYLLHNILINKSTR
jgi:hypothetical protein